MPETNISSSNYGNKENTITDFSVDPVNTEGPQDQKETTYDNNNWSTQFGYYKKIPELKTAIDALARWTIGKGFKSNEITEMTLSTIRGWGKDTFNTILENQTRVAKIGGDSFAEVIRDDKDQLINLKPLDPGAIRIIANRKGVIIRYEQINRIKGQNNVRWKPEQIFHLSRNRTADEIHGESIVDAVEEIILMRNEAMADYKKLLHRNVFPIIKWQLDTDDTTQIEAFKVKADKASTQGENLYIPKGAADADVLAVAPNSTLNPLPWIDRLNSYFYQAAGVPMIIVGGGEEITEASAKIAYLAWEQTVEEEQLYIEEQVLAQLNLEIELEFPATLQNELLSDQSKSETLQAATAEDTAVTNVGVQ